MNLFVPDPRIELTAHCAVQIQRMTIGARALVRFVLKCLADAAEGGVDFNRFQNFYCSDLPGAADLKMHETLGLRLLFKRCKAGLKIISVEFDLGPPTEPRPMQVYVRCKDAGHCIGGNFLSLSAIRFLPDVSDDAFIIRMSTSAREPSWLEYQALVSEHLWPSGPRLADAAFGQAEARKRDDAGDDRRPDRSFAMRA